MDEKQEDLKYIKSFTKISVNKVCKELGFNTRNILVGKATKEKIHLVRKTIEDKQARLYLLEVDNNGETSSTL